MKRAQMWLMRGCGVALIAVVCAPALLGWGDDGHSWINRAAALIMPSDYPAFMRSKQAVDALEYMAPEPDRWRSTTEPSLKYAQEPDHFIDLERVKGMGALPVRRFDFYRQLADYQRAQMADNVADAKFLTPDKVGLQPWETAEMWERLIVAFRHYRELQRKHKPTEEAEQAAIVYAGLLGHYVGDAANPMHTTIYYNGWVGENPNGYTTSKTIHSEFESVFVHRNIKPREVGVGLRPPAMIAGEWQGEWNNYLEFLKHSNALVEPLYQLEKTGAFRDKGTPAGHQFVVARLTEGAQELADLWYTAWKVSAEPVPEYHAGPAQPPLP